MKTNHGSSSANLYVSFTRFCRRHPFWTGISLATLLLTTGLLRHWKSDHESITTKPRTTASALAESRPASALSALPLPAQSVATASTAPGQPNQVLQALPQSEQQSLWTAFHAARRAVQALNEHEASLPQNEGVRFFASNPGQNLTARFLDGAVRIESGRGGAWAATLSHGAGQTLPMADGDRVEFKHPDGVTEWYVNRTEGIEHGFTVSNRPKQTGQTGELRVKVALAGLSARAVQVADRTAPLQAVEFFDASNDTAVLRYDKLKVNDATGRELPARFAVTGSTVTILVADAGATYPVTIDPLITSQEAQLIPQSDLDGGTDDEFGIAVAVDGDTALLGSWSDNTAAGAGAGSAHVFVRTGTNWIHQARLLANDATAADYFGRGVAISGSRALVGAYGDDTAGGAAAGSAYVFTRSGTAWSSPTKLEAGDAAGGDNFGFSVALSGTTALIGAQVDDTTAGSNAGSAYVFVYSGGVWSQQARLEASDGAASDQFAYSVAVDGNTALVGALYDDTAAGASAGSAYVFVRDGTVWSQQAKLTASDAATGDYFGISVAVSGDLALAGAYQDNTAGGAEAGSAYVFVRSGTNWTQEAKLEANDAAAGDRLGRSVALSGNTALVGANLEGATGAVDAGCAYVFVRSGTNWSQQAKLEAGDRDDSDQMGYAVALSGDTAVAGAPTDNTTKGANAGSAYVFVRNGTNWSQQAKLEARDGASSDYFGISVALEGNTALVGAYSDNTAAGSVGSAYVFVRSGTVWSLQKKLTASDAADNDWFGISVALSAETALVGARQDDNGGGTAVGSAYVFLRSGTNWSQQAWLTANDAIDYDNFGNSVALSSNTALVGAFNAGANNAGAAYVYVRSGTTWSQQTKITVGDAAANDYFGSSVALDGDTALVGSYNDYTGAAYTGSAFVFVRSGTVWSQQAKLIPSDGAYQDSFGFSVALSGDTALIGAYADDSPAYDAGSAYVFVRSGTTWSQQAKLTASDATGSEYFGLSVALSGDTALVGAPYDGSTITYNSGSVYAFVRSGTVWSQAAKKTAGDASTDDRFGYSVALSGDTALVGSIYDDTAAGTDTGSVYVFRLDFSPDIAVEQPTGNALTNGVSIHYGTNELGFGSVAKTFVLRNLGGSNLVLSAFTPSGPSGAHYSFNTSGMTYSIQPGSNTSFTVTYAPMSAGFHPHTLSILSNDPDQPAFTINFTGTGVDLDPGLVLHFPPPNPSHLDFGGLLVGTSSSKTLVISNTGPGMLAISNLFASAGTLQYFSINTNSMAGLVSPGGSTSVAFTYAPTNSGSHSLTMDLESNHPGGLVQFGVAGQAFFPNGDADGDGLNDFAEVQLAPLGFHWQTNNASLISVLYSNAYTAGLYTQAELQGLAVNSPLLSRDAVSGLFKLTIGVQKSTNLISFTHFPMTAPQTSINATGKLEFQFTSPDGAAFYRLEGR